MQDRLAERAGATRSDPVRDGLAERPGATRCGMGSRNDPMRDALAKLAELPDAGWAKPVRQFASSPDLERIEALTVRAERVARNGDWEPLASERPRGAFSRRIRPRWEWDGTVVLSGVGRLVVHFELGRWDELEAIINASAASCQDGEQQRTNLGELPTVDKSANTGEPAGERFQCPTCRNSRSSTLTATRPSKETSSSPRPARLPQYVLAIARREWGWAGRGWAGRRC